MSGGGGGSGNNGGGDQQAAAKAAMTSQAAYTSSASPATAPQTNAGGNDNDNYTQQSLQRYEASREDYDAPDRAHEVQTQRDIKEGISGLKETNQYDVSLTPQQSEQFQQEMNKHYGTEDKKYEEYGRAGEGTVNLGFGEHWKNATILHPALKLSPTLRFLYASGKNIAEMQSKYGTLSPQEIQDMSPAERGEYESQIMKNVAPEAPYIVSGITMPTDSPAANWYQNLGQTNTSPMGFNLADKYAAAKAKVSQTLSNSGSVGQMAVSNSPFFDFLKDNSLDKGIL